MIKFKANQLRSKYKINSKSSLEYLKLVIHKLGYNLSTYSEEKMKLVRLKRETEMQTAASLSIIDSKGNITVYYNDKLSPFVQRFALAHEIGHILLGHTRRNLTGKKQEDEADKFATFLLAPKQNHTITALQIDCLILCICLCITIICATLFNNTPTETKSTAKQSAPQQSGVVVAPQSSVLKQPPTNSQFCYFTSSGKVYHLYRDCYYIKNSKTVYTDAIHNSGKDRLCSACEYRKYKEN